MVEKQSGSEIAQSRERFEKWAFRGKQEGVPAKFYLLEFDKLSLDPVQYKDQLTQAAFAIWEQAERDTRERCAQLLEQRATVFTEVAHPEEKHKYAALVLQSEAESIRGKEVSR